MSKKGFTLIELLAVIVILAIVALLATPIVLKIIDSSKANADKISVDNYFNSIETSLARYLLSNKDIDVSGEYRIDGNYIEKISDNSIRFKVQQKGTKVTCDYIYISSRGNAFITDCKLDGKDNYVIINGTNYSTGERKYYNDGYIIYYDVLSGKKCSKSQYELSYDSEIKDYLNSNTGYNGINKTSEKQNSCLKFYVFGDDENNSSLNLLLDHNTTASIKWTTKSSFLGPDATLLGQLKTDTNDWKGTIVPSNYMVYQKPSTSVYGNYTINYNTENYKARLITAQEITNITKSIKPNFDESKNSFDARYYFCPAKKDCVYAWLYDRTRLDCTTYGCLNNSDIETLGYWSSTSVATVYTYYSWAVGVFFGNLGMGNINTQTLNGIRPVISISK